MDFLHTELVFAKNAQKNYYSRLFFIKRRRSCVRKISRIWTADANSSFFKWTWNNSTQSSQIILLRSQQITIYQKKSKKITYFFIFIILYVGRFYWGFVEGIKVVRPRKWIIMKLMASYRQASSPTSQNLPHTIISLILITLSVLDWDLSRLGKAPKTTWDEDGRECGLGSQECQKKLSKVLTREGKPFSIII